MKDTSVTAQYVQVRRIPKYVEDRADKVRIFRLDTERVQIQLRNDMWYAGVGLTPKQARDVIKALQEGLAEIEPAE